MQYAEYVWHVLSISQAHKSSSLIIEILSAPRLLPLFLYIYHALLYPCKSCLLHKVLTMFTLPEYLQCKIRNHTQAYNFISSNEEETSPRLLPSTYINFPTNINTICLSCTSHHPDLHNIPSPKISPSSHSPLPSPWQWQWPKPPPTSSSESKN
jgi:hypothetical protein